MSIAHKASSLGSRRQKRDRVNSCSPDGNWKGAADLEFYIQSDYPTDIRFAYTSANSQKHSSLSSQRCAVSIRHGSRRLFHFRLLLFQLPSNVFPLLDSSSLLISVLLDTVRLYPYLAGVLACVVSPRRLRLFTNGGSVVRLARFGGKWLHSGPSSTGGMLPLWLAVYAGTAPAVWLVVLLRKQLHLRSCMLHRRGCTLSGTDIDLFWCNHFLRVRAFSRGMYKLF